MEAETGWLACRKCRALLNTRAGNGECPQDHGMHDIMFSADYRVIWTEFPDNVQRGWGWCGKCSRLACRFVSPGACNDGGGHEFPEFSAELGVPFGPHDAGDYEAGWKWCNKCQCLIDTRFGPTVCYAGGNHDHGGSFEYWAPIVRVGVQSWWQWCERCLGLVRAGCGGCHTGEPHIPAAHSYTLAFGAEPAGTQPGWRACVKCAVLTFGGNGDGACYRGGTHDLSGALSYSVPNDTVPDGAQPGWRWCNRCGVLSLAQAAVGPCAAGGSHDHGGSGAYAVMTEFPDGGQPGWRRCTTCAAVTFTQLGDGVCLDGTAHDLAAKPYYVPVFGGAFEGETGWRLCRRCRVLFDAREGRGVCPVGGGPHDPLDSPLYVGPTAAPGDRTEAGWRRCAFCRELALESGGGRCVSGGPHDFSGSAAYVLGVGPDPEEQKPPPTPAGPQLAVTESAERIAVDGTGFGADASIEILIVHSGTTTTARLTADGAGTFRHTVEPVVANPAGGSVIARPKDGRPATKRLREFVPAPTGGGDPS
jgi:hypothetical protein